MDALFAKSVSNVFQVSLLALISVILIVWTLRWAVEVCCAVEMGTAIQKKPSHANVSFVFDFLTTRRLGGVDEAMGGPHVLRGLHVPRGWHRGQRPSRPDSCFGQKEVRGASDMQDFGPKVHEACTTFLFIP